MNKNYLYHTSGNHTISKIDRQMPSVTEDTAIVQSILTGVCRSDVDMYVGDVPPLPVGIFGHEGLGIVVDAGTASGLEVGSIVSTRSDCAFARYYVTKRSECVEIPEAHPRYIIEPPACGYNIGKNVLELIPNSTENILIYGSGFLSYSTVAYLATRAKKVRFTVVGRSYQQHWKNNLGIDLVNKSSVEKEKYSVVVLLTDKILDWTSAIEFASSANSLIVCGAVPSAITKPTLFQASWKNQTWIFPSPRDPDFHDRMRETVEDIKSGILDVDWVWTFGYAESRIEKAFYDGSHRTSDYCRGYVDWRLENS